MTDTERAELAALVAKIPDLTERLNMLNETRRKVSVGRKEALARVDACKLALEVSRQELDALERLTAPEIAASLASARGLSAELAEATRAEKRIAAADAPKLPAAESVARRYPDPAPVVAASAGPAIPAPKENP